jgi:hypothetical protein
LHRALFQPMVVPTLQPLRMNLILPDAAVYGRDKPC